MSASNSALFMVCSLLALGSAFATVLARRPLRGAVALLVHIVALAGLYLTLHAHLLAALQLLVYAGAVVVLFIFVIMMIGPASEAQTVSAGYTARSISAILVGTIVSIIAFGLVNYTAPSVALDEGYGTVEQLSLGIYKDALVPFELVSITLLVAIIGAVAVARGRTKEEAVSAGKRREEREAGRAARSAEERRLSAEVSAHGGH